MKSSLLLKVYWLILLSLAFFTVFPSLFPDIWFVDLFAHFRVQYLIILLLLLLLLFKFKNRLFPFLLIISLLAWNIFYIIPLYFSPLNTSEIINDELSILSINLLSSNSNYSEVVDLIKQKDPDIILLMELTPNWNSRLNDVFEQYQFNEREPRNDNFGIALLSKKEFTTSIIYFENSSKPSIIANLKFNNKPLTVLATHPVPPISSEMFNSRNSQLKDIARKRHDFSDNFILIGDLNTSSFSTHFRELLTLGELTDSRNGFGISTTWPADFFLLRTTLDHCLLGGDLKVITQGTERNIGSDHLPIFLKIGI